MIKDIIIAVVLLLILLLVWVAIFDINRFTVSNYKYTSKKLKKEFRAVVVSDLHNKKYGQGNERLIQAIKSEHPDMILVAGDIMNAHPRGNTDTALEFIEKLAGDFPIYYANGNHEMRMKLYTEDYGEQYEEYTAALRKLGVHHLVNDREVLEEYGVEIIGSEISKNHYIRVKPEPFGEGELVRELGEPSEDKYTILIAHNPYFFKDYAEYGADLVLSGHVHGGMVRVPFINKGIISPNVRFFPKYDGGEFTEGESVMIVSRGLGVHTIPVRMFNPGDLVVIDFYPD